MALPADLPLGRPGLAAVAFAGVLLGIAGLADAAFALIGAGFTGVGLVASGLGLVADLPASFAAGLPAVFAIGFTAVFTALWLPAFVFAFDFSPAFTFNFWDTFGIAFEVALTAPRDDVWPLLATDALLAASLVLALVLPPDVPETLTFALALPPAAALPPTLAEDRPLADTLAIKPFPDVATGSFRLLPGLAGRIVLSEAFLSEAFLEDRAGFIGL